MKIYTQVSFRWNGKTYVECSADYYEHDGPVSLCCGASSGQNAVLAQQTAFANQVQQQATQVFGNSSSVFTDLMNTFAPTVAAGPSQEGFSAAEKANLNSQAITQTGQAYRNARQAVGEAQAAQNGGNTPDVSGGSNVATDLNLASNYAATTANELGQINEQDYQTGRQNYDNAVAGLSKAPDAFSTSTGFDNAETNSTNAEANTANQIASQNNSWIQGVTGALGQVAGAATGGFMKNIGSGTSKPGKSSAN